MRVAQQKGHRLGAGRLDFAVKSYVNLCPHSSSLVLMFVGLGLTRGPQAPGWTWQVSVAEGCSQTLWKVTLDSVGGEASGCYQALCVCCLLTLVNSRLASPRLAHLPLPTPGILSEALAPICFSLPDGNFPPMQRWPPRTSAPPGLETLHLPDMRLLIHASLLLTPRPRISVGTDGNVRFEDGCFSPRPGYPLVVEGGMGSLGGNRLRGMQSVFIHLGLVVGMSTRGWKIGASIGLVSSSP